MKKSNKLLLGGFLTVLLTIAALHIALYAKFKNGNYTLYRANDEYRPKDKMHSFAGVKYVSFQNIGAANLQFGKQAEIEKGKEGMISYTHAGDSLIISGKPDDDQFTVRRTINFTVPTGVTISALNSFLYFENNYDDAQQNATLHVKQANVTFYGGVKSFHLGHINVTATDSTIISFQGRTQVDQLDVQLSHSALEIHEGDAGQLSIVTDSLSRISLQTKNLLKAKITTVPNTP